MKNGTYLSSDDSSLSAGEASWFGSSQSSDVMPVDSTTVSLGVESTKGSGSAAEGDSDSLTVSSGSSKKLYIVLLKWKPCLKWLLYATANL